MNVEREATVDASVVVPSYRGAHRLPTLLNALAAQDFTGSWQIIVVLDGVFDDTPALLASWRERLPLDVLVLPENRGVVAALNAGYERAAGRVLIRCDDDLTPRPDFVTRHVAWHNGDERVGVIGLTRNVYEDTAYARAYGRPADIRARVAARDAPPHLLYRHWAANNSITRESWELVGGFDPHFRYGQDSEFGWRLQRSGARLLIDPELEADHRGPAATVAVRLSRAFVSGASRVAFAQRHPEAVRQGSRDDSASLSPSQRMWRALVAVVAVLLRGREGCERLGRVIDAVITRLPVSLAGRLVALGVEAAACSGQRRGGGDLREYARQKQLELATEVDGAVRP